MQWELISTLYRLLQDRFAVLYIKFKSCTALQNNPEHILPVFFCAVTLDNEISMSKYVESLTKVK
jgi:hypothetical protein